MIYERVQSDLGTVWTFRLKRADGRDLDLTGATVSLLVSSQAARSCTLVTAALGLCSYTTVAADNATDGSGMTPDKSPYKARILADTGTPEIYSQPIEIVVYPKVPTP